jgi:hypothetical protein
LCGNSSVPDVVKVVVPVLTVVAVSGDQISADDERVPGHVFLRYTGEGEVTPAGGLQELGTR